MIWARIEKIEDEENFRVDEVVTVDPEGRFHPSLIWVSCPADVEPGYLYDGTAFTEPAPDYLAETAS